MMEKVTLTTLNQHRKSGQPIAMLTCYDFSAALLADKAGIDSLLVGDSLAQVVLGYPNTLFASMDIMIALTAAVRRGAPRVYLIGDMPFLSYQVSIETALKNAGRFLTEAGCDAVKIEADGRHLDVVAAMARASIPVMAHLGVRPQAIGQTGTFRAQGQTAEQAVSLITDAKAMVEAGACLLLLECVTAEVAAEITRRVDVPVISCGSGPDCDGQVLVWHDLMGLPGASGAKFTKSYAQLAEPLQNAMAGYTQDVHARQFPDRDHSYHMNPQEWERFSKLLNE